MAIVRILTTPFMTRPGPASGPCRDRHRRSFYQGWVGVGWALESPSLLEAIWANSSELKRGNPLKLNSIFY